jgi:hypothetical protein
MTPEHFRDLARRCRSWAHECFDLEGAMRFRMLAEELLAMAKELDSHSHPQGGALPTTHHTQPVQQQQAKTTASEDEGHFARRLSGN